MTAAAADFAEPGVLDGIVRLLGDTTGMVFPRSRRRDIETGLRKVMARAGIDDPRACLEQFAADPALLDDLIAGLTIGETYFFREPEHFAFIRDVVVPEIARLRGPAHVLRAWSAGCATGEEAYSLAIQFEEIGIAGRARVLATDISRGALARAAEGCYGDWSLRRGGNRLVGPHLRPAGNRFEVAGRLRRSVTFAYLNLAEDIYPSLATQTRDLDLVLCRNVLIYLDPETIGAIARRLHEALAPGGYLLTGPSDPLLGGHAPFETMTTHAGLIYRKTLPGRAPEIGSPPVPMPVAELPAAPRAESVPPMTRGRPKPKVSAKAPGVSGLVRRIRATADQGDAPAAMEAAAAAVKRNPASLELRFLHAMLLMSLGRHQEAERALRQVLFLDRTLAVAHFALGTTLRRTGDIAGARRSYANAAEIAGGLAAETVLPLADGEQAGELARAARDQLVAMEGLQ